MNNKSEILDGLREFKTYIKERFKVQDLWAFGSFMRGDQTAHSDIDILVDFADGADLFDLVELGLFLEEKLGRKVDIVSRRSIRKELKDKILSEIVAV